MKATLYEALGIPQAASDEEVRASLRRLIRKRPVMIHRALFGSIERFFGVLLEHYAGAFPAWLAPRAGRPGLGAQAAGDRA